MQGWMEQVPSHVMDFWEAFDAVEPIGEKWIQNAEITTMLSRLIEYTVALKTGKQLDATSVEDNMPARYRRIQKPKESQVVEKRDERSEFERVAASFGLTEIVKKHGRINKPS